MKGLRMTRFRQFIMESTRSKAGILPYYMDGDARKFLFMISSDPAFGGSDPMISKGKIDAGESSLQAALREGEEELGLKRHNIVDGTLEAGWSGMVSGLDDRYRMDIYVCEVKSMVDFGTPQYETEKTIWLDLASALKRVRASHRPIVNAIAAKLNGVSEKNTELESGKQMKLKKLCENHYDYDQDIDLSKRGLTKLPSDLPKKINGEFMCHENRLTTLEWCPSEVGGDFDCYRNALTSLEYCPSEVGGTFTCSFNDLTSLEHCPSVVGGNFNCTVDKLVSLEHCPSAIGGAFNCSANRLTSLEHCPSEVGKMFYCGHNELTSLKDIHKQIKKIGGDFRCYKNPIRSHILGLMLISIGGNISTGLGDGQDVDAILNKWKNQGRKGALGCQRELIEAGYEELAQL